jgi:replication-associated recombination protein RarA
LEEFVGQEDFSAQEAPAQGYRSRSPVLFHHLRGPPGSGKTTRHGYRQT